MTTPRAWFIALLLPLALHAGTTAASPPTLAGHGEYRTTDGPCVTPAHREQIATRIAIQRRALGLETAPHDALAGTVAMGWPLREANGLLDPGFHGISNFVDQNPANPGFVLDYQCGTRTYDQSGYNHRGTDFFTWPFGWYRMDQAQVQVVAAAPGIILAKDDGNYDRSCGFGGGNWNAVYVQHADGSVVWYGHLKNGSPTPKSPGEAVVEGEYLGVVGSSGNSTGPHLHLELYDSGSNLIDPYGGPCNTLNPSSWWADQRPYYDSALNAVMTHDAPPEFPPCPGTEILHARDTFVPGQTIYFAAYYRDQLAGQVSQYEVLDPYGAVWDSWSHSSSASHYAASYWYWYTNLPANAAGGVWTFRVTFEGETAAHAFLVMTPTAVEGPAESPRPPALRALYPNPVRDGATIEYDIARDGMTRLAIFDASGRRVALLVDRVQIAGTHGARWDGRRADGSPAGAGVYWARLEHDGQVRARRLVRIP